LNTSFRRIILYAAKAIKIIPDLIFCVLEIFFGHDPVMIQLKFWVMTQFRSRPKLFFGS
jgi:hypothetical protein